MKWLLCSLLILISGPSIASGNNLNKNISHTGEPCKTEKTLKREHPSQHIYYETINSKRCYHVHNVDVKTKPSANTWAVPNNLTFPKNSLNKSVLDYWTTPNMYWFYNEYTKGRAFGGG